MIRHFVALAKKECDAVRAQRGKLDIVTYKEPVDSAYLYLILDYLDDSIKKKVANVFPHNDVLQTRYSRDVFILCREICIELQSEFPYQEYEDSISARLERREKKQKESKK